MTHTKTNMDAASYALWQELRAPWIKRVKPKVLYGTGCSLLWLVAGLLFGKAGLLSLVLVWFALYLPVGVVHMSFASAKDDWKRQFTPSYYLLSPLIGFSILCAQVMGVFRGKPLIPTILTGKNLVGISRDVDEGHGYRFTMVSGKSATIIRDKYERQGLCIRFNQGPCGGAIGDLTGLLMYLDDALLGASTPEKD